ncbi:hypothetical protein M758_11G086800 [Ceratodon purpureus]|nr:hypothetical protein M758_11G086800 [Ceratodon purpureus]
MVACVAPAAHAKSEQSGSSAAGGGAAAAEWQSFGGGLAMHEVGNRTLGVPKSLAVAKPERQLYREAEGEGVEYDLYQHGRKRAKGHDGVAYPVLQSSGRASAVPFASGALEHGSGGGLPLSSRILQAPMMRKSNSMLPPAPVSVPQVQCNPLDEPSPLGLTLKKTPSLLDLITYQLQHNASAQAAESENSGQGLGKSRIGKCLAPTGSAAQDKLKASNFPASTLKIGTWERTSRYEGDLVAKCYYAKRKLVWEVLDSGLKSKVEIQWSDISAMKATCPDNLPGSLEIEVSRPPLFFKETNPQPRKHTLWQATTDFTGGQASICKVHYLQFPEGVLNRHYEKLVQCDPRLKALVEGTLSGSGPRYESSESGGEGQSVLQHSKGRNAMAHMYDGLNERPRSPLSPLSPLSPYSQLQGRSGGVGVVEADVMRSNETSSPSSVMEIRRCEEGGDSDSGEYYVREELGSYSPYAVDSGYCGGVPYEFPEMKAAPMNVYAGSGGMSASNRQILDEIAQVLLGDSSASLSTEQAILLAARMGSMQAVIGSREFQSGPMGQAGFEGFPVADGSGGYYGASAGRGYGLGSIGGPENNFDTNSRLTKCSNMLETSFNCLQKNSSTGDLLMNLPRVASLPQLFESVSTQVPLSRYMGIQ